MARIGFHTWEKRTTPSVRSPFVMACCSIVVLCASVTAQDQSTGHDANVWVPAMKRVNATFSGEQGTLALFGDSITASKAFCFGLQYAPDGDDREMLQALGLVKSYMLQDC